MTHLAAVIFFVGCAFASEAQNFKEAVLKAKAAYGSLDRLHAVMQVQVFEKSSSKKPFAEQRAEVKRDGVNYLASYEDLEVLVNKNFTVAVNHTTRQINVNVQDNVEGAAIIDPINTNLDSLLGLYGKIEYLGTSDNRETFKVYTTKGSLEAIRVAFNQTTSLIYNISYLYKDGVVASVTFISFDNHPKFESDVFDERNYIARQNKKVVPAQAFRGFQIIYKENR